MTRRRSCRGLRRVRAMRGFTLLEALVAVALTGLVLGMIGTVTAQWLPAWSLGFARLQRADLVALAAERMAADLASAEFVSLDPKSQRASFDGTPTAVAFVRSRLGPNAEKGLEIIKIAEEEEAKGSVVVRSRAPFALIGQASGGSGATAFTDRIALLRHPYRVTFAFADATKLWRGVWRDMSVLPTAVRISIVDESKSRAPFLSTVALLHVSIAAVCSRTPSAFGCLEELTRNGTVSIPRDSRGQKN
jgi:general secretion pathway protein J